MSGILESCKDWKIALLNFTGPNTDPLEYATKSIPQLAKGVSEFKEIFEYNDGKGTIRDYLQNEIRPTLPVGEIDKYDIRGDLIYFYDQMLEKVEEELAAAQLELAAAKNDEEKKKKIKDEIAKIETKIAGFDTDPIYKALKKEKTFLDLPMKILGRILVKEKSIGGFDKYAKRENTNPLKKQVADDKIYQYFFGDKTGPDDDSWTDESKGIEQSKGNKVEFFRNYKTNDKSDITVEGIPNPNFKSEQLKKIGRTLLFLYDILINKLLSKIEVKDKVGSEEFNEVAMTETRYKLINKFIKKYKVDIMFLTEFRSPIDGPQYKTPADYTLYQGRYHKKSKLCNAILINTEKFPDTIICSNGNVMGKRAQANLNPDNNTKFDNPEQPCIVDMTDTEGNTITLISIHTSGKATTQNNIDILKKIQTNFKHFIYGVDANAQLYQVTSKLPDETKLIYPTKKEDGLTINTSRTVFQTQLDKSPIVGWYDDNFDPNAPSDPDKSQKDYIISNIDCLKNEAGQGQISVLTTDGEMKKFKRPPSKKNAFQPHHPSIPIWTETDGITHPFDHALVTNFKIEKEKAIKHTPVYIPPRIKTNWGGRRKRTRKKLHHRKKKYSLKKHKHIKKRTRRRKTTHAKKRTRRRKK